MGSSTKLLVTKASQSAGNDSVLFGEVFRATRDTLANMGAYSSLNDFKQKVLTHNITVSFGEGNISGSYPFTIAWINVAGFPSEETRNLFFFQNNTDEFKFLPAGPYLQLSLDAKGTASDILLKVASKLIEIGFDAFFCQNDGVSTEYVPVTLEYAQNNLENVWPA